MRNTLKSCLILATSIASLNLGVQTNVYADAKINSNFAKGQIILKVGSLTQENLIKLANFAKSKGALKITSMLHPTAILNLKESNLNVQASDFVSKISNFSSNLNSKASPNRLSRVRSNASNPSKNNIIVIFPEGTKVDQIQGLFAGLPAVTEISLNYQMQLLALPNDRFVDSDQNNQLDVNPSTGLPWAWHLTNIGADQPRSQTGRGIVVAVVDSGTIEEASSGSRRILPNPELKDQHWINPGEVPNDGIDNDRNGFVDDVNGANLSADEECDTKGTSCAAIDRGIPWSLSGDFHGVAVASTIAAKNNNGIGMAGIADGVKVMGVKVFKNGSTTTSTVAKGIVYAVRNGADVINLSLGGDYGLVPNSQRKMIEDALDTAYSNGVIVIASAGNDHVDSAPYLPAASSKVICVAATDINNKIASFSNFGRSVDIAAPGKTISVFNVTSLYGFYPNPYTGRNIDRPELFSPLSGTSFSAPIVSGVVALMLEKNPALRMEEISSILKATATPVVGDTKGIQGGIVNIPRALAQVKSASNGVVLRQNPSNRYDVTADGMVSPMDVLTVINAMNGGPVNPNAYYDVNGNGELSPLDALLIINYMNSGGR